MKHIRSCIRALDAPALGIIAVVVTIGLVAAPARSANPETVTECGQVVTSGVLTGDLDCSGAQPDNKPAGPVVRSLDLQGFTITGPASLTAVVRCQGKNDIRPGSCRIFGGGGTLRHASPGEGYGVEGSRVKLYDVTLENASVAVWSDRAVVVDSTIVTPALGVWANKKAQLVDSTVIGGSNGGVKAGNGVKLIRSSVTGSGYEGIVTRGRVLLSDSSVTGNVVDAAGCATQLNSPNCPGSGALLCADVAAGRRVKLRGASACGSSLVQDVNCVGGNSILEDRSGATFGVCSTD